MPPGANPLPTDSVISISPLDDDCLPAALFPFQDYVGKSPSMPGCASGPCSGLCSAVQPCRPFSFPQKRDARRYRAAGDDSFLRSADAREHGFPLPAFISLETRGDCDMNEEAATHLCGGKTRESSG